MRLKIVNFTIFLKLESGLTNVKAALVGISDRRFTALTVAVAAVRLENLDISFVANIFVRIIFHLTFVRIFVYFLLFMQCFVVATFLQRHATPLI